MNRRSPRLRRSRGLDRTIVRLWPLLACVLIAGASRAHPLDAPAARNPLVPGFDRLAAEAASEAEVAQSGLLLMAELNCAACHEAPAEWREQLKPAPASNLAGVGSRLPADALRRVIGNPQQCIGGARMPRLFADEVAGAARIDALVEYLASLKQPIAPMPAGDAANGKQLYHSTGCVACHAPAADARPASLPADQEILAPREESIPLGLAREYEPQALAQFLLDPLRDQPAGRMPSMHLSAQEAADIAKYLQRDEAGKPPASKPVPERIADGREQFAQQRCAACHGTGEKLAAPAAPALARLS
ncbi:MAG TPA: c-type cytochrome, partial [Chthoniobacteraceae bacterium]|nr:c-type cytochrome [Chthoniobacteraceae bacterium]